ncbi:hypothetical protein CRUP_022387, partial [Coryphaenoides rupestris]
ATVTGQYQYPDTHPGSEDIFSREPFAVRFSAPTTDIKEFVLIPIHTSPSNATKEIDSLYDVFKDVKKKLKTENVMFLGDFNAGCSYLPKKYRKDVRLLTDSRFEWLIDDVTDTTVRESTTCAYDRIVVHGNAFSRAIVPHSAGPFIFPDEYKLTEEQALSVSDHYPVQVTLVISPKGLHKPPSMGCCRVLLSLWGVCGLLGASGFRICAFNLHGFGESKSNNDEVMRTLVKIISRYDVCVLQEVRDSRNKAMPKLRSKLNRYNRKYTYDYLASERLGRSAAYQEQYVFVYRTQTATVTGQYQYPDTHPGSEDIFSREPFAVRFSAPTTDVKKKLKTENVMFLGDFNAGCSYLPKKYRKDVRLLTDSRFEWLIDDVTDTTVRESTTCAYDRIVVHGNAFSRAIVPHSAGPFIFPDEYKLTEEQALSVSDHYPVEVTLRSGSQQNPVYAFTLVLVLLICWVLFS